MKFRIALIGAPNCGKSTLFNGLTGGSAKTANYAGVTVETKSGNFETPMGRRIEIYDLPGIYGLTARSADEKVTLELARGAIKSVGKPNLLLMVLDAANLRTHLHSAIQMKELGISMIIVLNMMDIATRDGTEIDIDKLSEIIGYPVIATRATRKEGRAALLQAIDSAIDNRLIAKVKAPEFKKLVDIQKQSREIANKVILKEGALNKFTRRMDSIVLHPLAGLFILALTLFFMFQAVFNFAQAPMELIENVFAVISLKVHDLWGEGVFGRLISDGIIGGVGSVLVFLPQILILFSFIILLEASGYMARAAFLMDELMHKAGLNGRAFIPLLSSFACAIPGIMSTRVIEHERDRLTTILIAPLMTCSARLPVYTLIISAFIPNTKVFGFIGLQGLVMFGLYATGVIGAFVVAFVLKRLVTKGTSQALIMELPSYKLPNLSDFTVGITAATTNFLRRAGTVILGVSIVLWVLTNLPSHADNLSETLAGRIGSFIEPALRPIGFNLEISIALIPGLAAREVAVGALGTIYAVTGGGDNVAGLGAILQSAWSLPTALAFLAWYVFAPQCFATLATMRRETNSWKWPVFAFVYLMALAYIAAAITYHFSKFILGL